jgi:anti-sigma regulatory factor (Ser/Thr protein kinase)
LTDDFRLQTIQNTLIFGGFFRLADIDFVLARARQIVSDARYPAIRFDFTDLQGCYPSAMTALLSRVRFYQVNQIDTLISLPALEKLRIAFMRQGWAHFFDDSIKLPPFKLEKTIPLFHYNDAEEQGNAVNCIIKGILLQVSGLDRRQIAAAQWALSEITDNVLNHSQSVSGGFVSCQIHRDRKQIEFVVADSGIGIARTLKEPEGVTSNSETNQGNGLYGAYRLAVMSNGVFAIHSHRGTLYVSSDGRVKIDTVSSSYPGTYVVCQIDYSDSGLIERALTFKGKTHTPAFDYIEQNFESSQNGAAIRLADQVSSLGSRESGRKISNLLNNVLGMVHDSRIEIDFDGILVLSSSFADECFGRVISSIGPVEFFSRISFINVDPTVRAIIDRSVVQRMRLHQN